MSRGSSSTNRFRIKLPGRKLLLAGLILLPWALVVHGAKSPRPKKVLALYWYGKDYPANTTFEQGLQTAFRSGPAGSIDYYAEYFESNRFPGESQSLLLHDYLRRKYTDRKIDVVVATSVVSLEFLLKHRDDLFPGAPIIFHTVKRPQLRNRSGGPGLTGVITDHVYRNTLGVALKLHPATRQAFIITASPEGDKSFEEDVREELKDFESKLTLTYLSDVPLAELITRVRSVPERSIILYARDPQAEPCETLEPYDDLALVAHSAHVPVYSTDSLLMGRGAVGGYVIRAEASAAKVAEIVQQIANGTRAQDIPVSEVASVPMFDWQQLRRWGIREKNLPSGSVVRFKEPTFWEHYKWQIISVLTLCVLQALLISHLLIERAQRRLAKAALGERLRFETLLSELSAEFTSLPADEVDRGIEKWVKRLSDFLGVDGAAFWELPPNEPTGGDDTESARKPDFFSFLGFPEEEILPYLAPLRHGETVSLPCVPDTPPAVTAGKTPGGRRETLKSLLAIPIEVDGALYGLAFTTWQSSPLWREDVVPRLRLAGEIFGSAILRKSREEALRESEERHRAFFELTAVGAGEANPENGRLLRVNEAHCRITGYTRDELLGMSFIEITHPEDREKDLEKLRRLVRGEVPEYSNEKRYLRKDGQVVWVQVHISLVRDSQGRPVHTVAVVQDITERKRVEGALRESEERSQAILRAIPDLMFLMSADGVYLDYHAKNPSDLLVPPGAFLGKNFRDIFSPELAEGFGLCFERALETREPQTHEYELLLNGEVRQYEARIVSTADHRLLSVVRDITGRKRAEEELLRISGRLLDLQDEERRRIARQLHDVTAQNLFAISINLARLQESTLPLPSQFKDALVESQNLCEQSLQEIRTLSYLLHPPMLDQAGLVSALRWYINGFARRSGIEVSLVVTQEVGRLPQEMETDLFRIVQEGLANVLRHSGSSTATVRLEKDATQLTLEISDQGRGMPERAVTAVPNRVESLGIGIAGMRQRLHQLGGRLRVTSVGQGTTVTATVPLPAEEPLRRAAGRGTA